MCIVTVNIPEAVRENTRMDTATTADFTCQMVAIAYYVRLRQPIEQCALIAGMTVEAFTRLLEASGVDVDAARLLSEIERGYRSGEDMGWHTTEQARARRHSKRAAMEGA